MRNALLAAAVLAAPLHAAVDFDRGVRLPSLAALAAEGAATPTPASSDKRVVRWLGGTKDVDLAEGVSASAFFTLSSTAIVEECDFDPRTGRRCRETFGQTVRETLRLVVRNRPAGTGTEGFRVLLDGPQVSVWQLRVRRPYEFRREGRDLVLTPK